MTSKTFTQVAFFKCSTTSSIPHRNGPVQCVRNCSRCIIDNRNILSSEEETLLNFKTYDNLILRKSLLGIPHSYQSVQYHKGQLDLLKSTLLEEKSQIIPTIFIVGVNNSSDVYYLNQVLEYEGLKVPYVINCNQLPDSGQNLKKILDDKKYIVIPILSVSCFTRSQNDQLIDKSDLVDLLEATADLKLNIVPVAITKEHDKSSVLGIGSLCVQIIEAYYLNNSTTSSSTKDLLTHIYNDITTHSVILPAHLIAFLLLEIERDEGVRFQDLVDYLKWFRTFSINIDLHLGFTGKPEDVVQFGLTLLEDYVQFDPTRGTYIVREEEALFNYALPIIPRVLHYGIIATAIMSEYNITTNNYLRAFNCDLDVKVEKEKVIEYAEMLAYKLDNVFCKRPCCSIETIISETYYQMENFGNFFKTVEPALQKGINRRNAYWEGESDDEEYYRNNRDNPGLKTWIILTKRTQRLDRLNLFMNSVDGLL